MQESVTGFSKSHRLLLTIGTLSLGAMLTLQTLGIASVASANSRDEFPGRRQGGGTHWVMPSDNTL